MLSLISYVLLRKKGVITIRIGAKIDVQTLTDTIHLILFKHRPYVSLSLTWQVKLNGYIPSGKLIVLCNVRHTNKCKQVRLKTIEMVFN